MNFKTPLQKVILFSIFYFLFLLSFNNSPLYDQDEAAYAGFARQMLESHDFILQDFPFSEPHKKPPLHMWISAASFYIFGTTEFSLRILPALWIVFTCILTYLIAKHLFNEKIGETSYLVLATSLYFPLNGKIALVDALLTFTLTLGFFALTKIIFPTNLKTKKWVAVFWLSVVLGSLTKGPPIFIYLGGIAFVCLCFKQTRYLILVLKPWFFLPLSVIPLLLWGYFAWIKTNGEMIRWMVDWYVLRRATDPVFGQSGPPGTYLLLFFVTFFPWSSYLPSVFKNLFTYIKDIKDFLFKKTHTTPVLQIFVLSGLFFGWIFYEFLLSKLPSYVLASYPILAILIAKSYSESKSENFKKWILAVALIFTFSIHVFLAPFLNSMRTDTKRVAERWNLSIPNSVPFYVLKNYALPSLAFYSRHKLLVLDSIQDFKNIPNGSYILIDPDLFLVLTSFGLEAETIENPQPIFAYDRNKTMELMIIRTK